MRGSPSNSGTRAVLDEVRRLVRALRLTAREAERTAGVSAAQLFVLRTLEDGEPLALKELAARTATDPSSVSVVAARLEDGGLVARARSATDGRRFELRLTARGRRTLRRAPRTAQEGLIRGVSGLTPGERRTLGKLLARVVSAMGPAAAAEMFFEGEAGPAPKRPRAGR